MICVVPLNHHFLSCLSIFEIWVFESRGSFIFSRENHCFFSDTHQILAYISLDMLGEIMVDSKATSEFSIPSGHLLQRESSPTEISADFMAKSSNINGGFQPKKNQQPIFEDCRSTMRKSTGKIHELSGHG